MTYTSKNTTHTVLETFMAGRYADNLGLIKAQISDLTTQADENKAYLIAAAADTGICCVEGALFRATVSFGDKRKTNWQAVIDDLCDTYDIPAGACGKIVLKHTEVAEGVPCVRVSARKGD